MICKRNKPKYHGRRGAVTPSLFSACVLAKNCRINFNLSMFHWLSLNAYYEEYHSWLRVYIFQQTSVVYGRHWSRMYFHMLLLLFTAVSECLSKQSSAWRYTWWIGAQRIDPASNSPFVWKSRSPYDYATDGFIQEMKYSNFEDGQPDFYRGWMESCLHMMSSRRFQWNDIECHKPNCFLCELEVAWTIINHMRLNIRSNDENTRAI